LLLLTPSLFSPFPRRPPSSPLFPYTTLFRSAFSPCVLLPPAREGNGFTMSLELRAQFSPKLILLCVCRRPPPPPSIPPGPPRMRSEEHTSELQSRFDLVCRLLLEKKNTSTP